MIPGLELSIIDNLSPQMIEIRNKGFENSLLNNEAEDLDKAARHVVLHYKKTFLGAVSFSEAAKTISLWSNGINNASKEDIFMSRGFIVKNPYFGRKQLLTILLIELINSFPGKNILTSVRPERSGVIKVLEHLGFDSYDLMFSYHSKAIEPVELILYKLHNNNLNFESKKAEIISHLQQEV